MNFTTPTTKAEMLETLKDIFYYYRIKRESFEQLELSELSLSDLNYVSPTALQTRNKAVTLLAPAQKTRVLKYKEGLTTEKSELTEKLSSVSAETQVLLEKIRVSYEESLNTVQQEAVKKGVAHSSIVLDKIAAITGEKNQKILDVNTESQQKISDINAKIAAIDDLLDDADTYYSEIEEAEIQAKIVELNEKEEEKRIEVFKYNNGLHEKEVKYLNSITVKTASLQLQYMDIVSDFYTKDELVEMGYYTDAISCVVSYYNTLSAYAAYTDIVADRTLPIYLDDYYSNVVYMYRTKAGQ